MQLFFMHKTRKASQKISKIINILWDLEIKFISAVSCNNSGSRYEQKVKKPVRKILSSGLCIHEYMVRYINCSLYGHLRFDRSTVYLIKFEEGAFKYSCNSTAVSVWCSLAKKSSQTGVNPSSYLHCLQGMMLKVTELFWNRKDWKNIALAARLILQRKTVCKFVKNVHLFWVEAVNVGGEQTE